MIGASKTFYNQLEIFIDGTRTSNQALKPTQHLRSRLGRDRLLFFRRCWAAELHLVRWHDGMDLPHRLGDRHGWCCGSCIAVAAKSRARLACLLSLGTLR